MQEFVILFHQMPPEAERTSHWDLMLRDGPHLLTWALEEEPGKDRTVQGVQLAHHDVKYLDYEGDVSRGRGRVSRVMKGHFQWLTGKDTRQWRIRMLMRNQTWSVTARRLDDQGQPVQRFEFRFRPESDD